MVSAALVAHKARRTINRLGRHVWRFPRTQRNTAVVLLLHEVDEHDAAHFSENTTPVNFSRLLTEIQDHYTIIPLSELFNHLANRTLDNSYLSLTFDDGAASIARNVYPVLKDKNIPATVFLTTDCIGDKCCFWPYVYNYMLNSGRASEFIRICRVVYHCLDVTTRNVKLYTNQLATEDQVSEVLKGVFEEIMPVEQYYQLTGRQFLDEQEIRETSDILEYGVHTASHPCLASLSASDVREEFRRSLDVFKRIFPDRQPILAIPFGGLGTAYNRETIKIAAEFDLTRIVSAYGGCNSPGQPWWSIRRIPVSDRRLGTHVHEFVSSLQDSHPRFADMLTEKAYRLAGLGRWE